MQQICSGLWFLRLGFKLLSRYFEDMLVVKTLNRLHDITGSGFCCLQMLLILHSLIQKPCLCRLGCMQSGNSAVNSGSTFICRSSNHA
jgi:hypothetical protein